jgi:hypothetical protein
MFRLTKAYAVTMRRYFVAAGVCMAVSIGIAMSGMAATTTGASPEGERTPVLIELFTSEGCSSCPAADTLLSKLVTLQPIPNVEIVALGLHVDYWDRLGWRDQFSSATYTARQNAYADAWRSEKVYTPQAVVDGAREVIGSDFQTMSKLIAESAATPKLAVNVALAEDAAPGRTAIRIAIAPRGDKADYADAAAKPLTLKGDVLVAITQDGLSSNVQAGENKNRLLSHIAVVRSLDKAGSFNGREPFTVTRPLSLDKAWPRNTLKAVVIVQDGRSRKVVGVGSCRLSAE